MSVAPDHRYPQAGVIIVSAAERVYLRCCAPWPSMSGTVARREPCQTVTERARKRLELRLEIAPVTHRRAINGLTNLFRTGSAHGALCLIECEAPGFEGQ